ncbi:MAG TPA: LLM class flavin-dependent oxidoreductase, partial [Acidimicrobiia bacterium]|nr:LLM class flavin-dependent oxidoreductase [Acidimicrobiia bacterium]
MQLTGTGVWSGHLRYGDAGEIAEVAAELDSLGYRAIWIPDVGGDVLGSVELLLRATPKTVVATGILNIWMHEPADVAAQRAAWSEEWQRRFLLGLGVSHAVLIDHENPGRYSKPYSKMVDFLERLDAAPTSV